MATCGMEHELCLQDIQKKSLAILSHIHDICEKNGIKYVLAYGTLIGAVRHKGFIPWDDDIDIFIAREDYWRFKDLILKDNQYYFLDMDSTQDYYYMIARVCDKNTRLIQNNQKQTAQMGCFIDVYPLDNATSNRFFAIIFKCIFKELSNVMIAYSYLNPNDQLRVEHWYNIRRIAYRFFLQRIDRRFFVELYEKLYLWLQKRDNSLYINGWDWKIDDVYSSNIINERVLMVFEGKEFYVPKDYDEVLKKYYGDYMQLPPVNEQRPHHDYVVYVRTNNNNRE